MQKKQITHEIQRANLLQEKVQYLKDLLKGVAL